MMGAGHIRSNAEHRWQARPLPYTCSQNGLLVTRLRLDRDYMVLSQRQFHYRPTRGDLENGVLRYTRIAADVPPYSAYWGSAIQILPVSSTSAITILSRATDGPRHAGSSTTDRLAL